MSCYNDGALDLRVSSPPTRFPLTYGINSVPKDGYEWWKWCEVRLSLDSRKFSNLLLRLDRYL